MIKNKDDIENEHLNLFLESQECLKYFNKSTLKIIKNKQDPPDFILLTDNNQAISIELTTLDTDSLLGRLQYALDNVVKKVFKKIDKYLDTKYYIKLASLEFSVRETKLSLNNMTEQIFDIISNPNKYEIFQKNNHFFTKSRIVYGDVYIVKFKNEYNQMFVLWFAKSKEKENYGGVALASFNTEDNYEQVENFISRKEQRLLKYKDKYDKNILLLVSDPRISLATVFKFTDKFYQTNFKTNFDEIFILNIFCEYKHSVHKLKITTK